MEYANYISTLKAAGDDLQLRIRRELAMNRKKRSKRTGRSYSTKINASGNLSKSITPIITSIAGQAPSLDIQSLPYGDFVNNGRKAGSFVPIAPLMNWIQIKPLKARDADGKFIKMDDAKIKSMAIAISKSIHKHGIAPTNIMTDSTDVILNKWGSRLLDAWAEDMEVEFNR